jgi:hypothetical protein
MEHTLISAKSELIDRCVPQHGGHGVRRAAAGRRATGIRVIQNQTAPMDNHPRGAEKHLLQFDRTWSGEDAPT